MILRATISFIRLINASIYVLTEISNLKKWLENHKMYSTAPEKIMSMEWNKRLSNDLCTHNRFNDLLKYLEDW